MAQDPTQSDNPFDPQAFFRQMQQGWQGVAGLSGLPGNLNPDELDKRIAELRAVEQWLNMNLGMLRTSIQAMEVQRGTLAALKAFGDNLARPPGPTGHPTAPSPDSEEANPPDATQATELLQPWWNALQQQFQMIADSALAGQSVVMGQTDSSTSQPRAAAGTGRRKAASADSRRAGPKSPDPTD